MKTGPVKIQVRILGCGSSSGVPRIDGDWGRCNPLDPRNRRTRCSILVRQWAGDHAEPTQVLIDCSPDMRSQLLAAGAKRLDAVLITHDHADQTHGLDDLRILAYVARRRMPVHMDDATYETLGVRFGYCFKGKGSYPAILDPRLDLAPLTPVEIDGPGGMIRFIPLAQDHGFGVKSLGFRFGPFAYCNDTVGLPTESLDAVRGASHFIVDALRYEPHPTHAHLDMALGWIRDVNPSVAVLTNLHVDMDYVELSQRLPDGVSPAMDGLELTAYCT